MKLDTGLKTFATPNLFPFMIVLYSITIQNGVSACHFFRTTVFVDWKAYSRPVTRFFQLSGGPLQLLQIHHCSFLWIMLSLSDLSVYVGGWFYPGRFAVWVFLFLNNGLNRAPSDVKSFGYCFIGYHCFSKSSSLTCSLCSLISEFSNKPLIPPQKSYIYNEIKACTGRWYLHWNLIWSVKKWQDINVCCSCWGWESCLANCVSFSIQFTVMDSFVSVCYIKLPVKHWSLSLYQDKMWKCFWRMNTIGFHCILRAYSLLFCVSSPFRRFKVKWKKTVKGFNRVLQNVHQTSLMCWSLFVFSRLFLCSLGNNIS